MSVRRLLSVWRADPEVGGQVTAWRNLPPRPAQIAALPPDLHPFLAQALQQQGISELYSHQAAAWKHARRGENVVIVTGTASGKTLAYNLPVLDCLLHDPDARALYLFPTKALAQDQLSSLKALVGDGGKGRRAVSDSNSPLPPISIPIGVYDGDTPASSRPAVRANSRVLISNPDMVHTGILPHHTSWANFFQNLRFIVIDEMHVYRGVFGSHVANVLRRLKRAAAFYGAFPQFLLTSATIANPVELAENRWKLRSAW
jgi:DEAD/DEAH box helicase domain-containing protein